MFVYVPSQGLNFQCHNVVLLCSMFLRWEVIVRFVNIYRIVSMFLRWEVIVRFVNICRIVSMFLRWEVIVRFVNIYRIVHRYFLSFIFIAMNWWMYNVVCIVIFRPFILVGGNYEIYILQWSHAPCFVYMFSTIL